MDNKYFMHFRNQIHQAQGDETVNANPSAVFDASNVYNPSTLSANFSSDPVFGELISEQQSSDAPMMDPGQAAAIVNDTNYPLNECNKQNASRIDEIRSTRFSHADAASGFSRDRNMANSYQQNRPSTK